MTSRWQEHDIEVRVIQILRDVSTHEPSHHFGQSFLTAYQLAIEFDLRHPEVARDLGYEVGGLGIGQKASLAQYLAKQLSQRIRDGSLPQIEGAFLADAHVSSMVFDHDGEVIESSLTGTGFGLSMFRYIGD